MNNSMCYITEIPLKYAVLIPQLDRYINIQIIIDSMYEIITRNMKNMMTRIITNNDQTCNFPESKQKLYPLLRENQCFHLPALISC